MPGHRRDDRVVNSESPRLWWNATVAEDWQLDGAVARERQAPSGPLGLREVEKTAKGKRPEAEAERTTRDCLRAAWQHERRSHDSHGDVVREPIPDDVRRPNRECVIAISDTRSREVGSELARLSCRDDVTVRDDLDRKVGFGLRGVPDPAGDVVAGSPF